MTRAHPLDRPAWAALSTHWTQLALQEKGARRLHPDYGPFAASEDAADLASLLPLAAVHGPVWIVEEALPSQIPAGLRLEKHVDVLQMVATNLRAPRALPDLEELQEDDGVEMRALAQMTEPGPFAEKTHLLGRFVGVRRNGKIAAMAGERMRFPGFVEISGVCTHPDYRGEGLAAATSFEVARAIIAAGATAFLHCYPDNAPAIAAYERIGFTTRRRLTAMILVSAESTP